MNGCTHELLVLSRQGGPVYVAPCAIGAIEVSETGDTRITVQGDHVYVSQSPEAVYTLRSHVLGLQTRSSWTYRPGHEQPARIGTVVTGLLP